MTTPRDDDDLIPGLPPVDGGNGVEPTGKGEEPIGVDDDDLGDSVGDGEESIGLDADTGPEDFDETDLVETEEEAALIADSEAAGDVVGDDAVDAGGEEEGWIRDSEAQEGEYGEDEGLADDSEPTAIDAGEEGLDDDGHDDGRAEAADDDSAALPPMRETTEDELDRASEDLDLEEEANVEGGELSYEQEARSAGHSIPPLLDAWSRVEHLGPDDDAIVAVATAGGEVWACGETLFRLRGERLDAQEPDGLAGHELTSVALDPRNAWRMAVGTRLGGAFRSVDGGETFVPCTGRLGADAAHLSTAVYVTAEVHGDTVRLWARTRAGALYRSDDFGATWQGPMLISPVTAMAADARGGIVVLCVPRVGPLQIGRSDDGGLRWTMRQGPERASSETPLHALEYHLDVLDDVIAVSCDVDPDGVRLSRDAGASWTRLSTLAPPGPVALVREEGRIVLYAALFFAGVDRGVVVRQDASGAEATILDVARERSERHVEGRGDPEGDNRIFMLRARHDGSGTLIHVATGAGLFQVRIAEPSRKAD